MPAVSKAQQQAMGIAHGIQKGTAKPKAGTVSAKIAKSMKPGDVKKFAKTPRTGLPAKKESALEKLREFIRETIREVLSEREMEEGYPKKHHGRRKIGSKKRRAIKKKRDARKQRR